MHYEAYVPADPRGPEVFILRVGYSLKTHARLSRIHLQLKGCGLRSLLLLIVEFREATSERISNKKFHQLPIPLIRSSLRSKSRVKLYSNSPQAVFRGI